MHRQLAKDPAHRGAPPDNDSTSLAGDMLYGARAIAAFLGKSERQVFHLAATRQLPIGKMGHELVSTKSRLRGHIANKLSVGA
jgi:hypothetical protein